MRKGNDSTRKVWIKRYLRTALGEDAPLPQYQLYRLLRGDMGPTALRDHLKKHGYQFYKDGRRTKKAVSEDDTGF